MRKQLMLWSSSISIGRKASFMESGKVVAWYYTAGRIRHAPLSCDVGAYFLLGAVSDAEFTGEVDPHQVGSCWVLMTGTGTKIQYPKMTWGEWNGVVASLAETMDALREQVSASY